MGRDLDVRHAGLHGKRHTRLQRPGELVDVVESYCSVPHGAVEPRRRGRHHRAIRSQAQCFKPQHIEFEFNDTAIYSLQFHSLIVVGLD